MATSGRGSGVVGYNVQVAVDTEHHLIITHEVTNVGTDRSQLAHVAKETKTTLEAESLDIVADRGHFNSEEILACEKAGITVTLPKPMGATHFLMKTLPRVASEMALHVLAYNLTRVRAVSFGTRDERLDALDPCRPRSRPARRASASPSSCALRPASSTFYGALAAMPFATRCSKRLWARPSPPPGWSRARLSSWTSGRSKTENDCPFGIYWWLSLSKERNGDWK